MLRAMHGPSRLAREVAAETSQPFPFSPHPESGFDTRHRRPEGDAQGVRQRLAVLTWYKNPAHGELSAAHKRPQSDPMTERTHCTLRPHLPRLRRNENGTASARTAETRFRGSAREAAKSLTERHWPSKPHSRPGGSHRHPGEERETSEKAGRVRGACDAELFHAASPFLACGRGVSLWTCTLPSKNAPSSMAMRGV
jgi:hypothetical protein